MTANFVAGEAAQRLRESNRLLAIAESLANLGRWRFEPNERLVERSPQASAILGVGPNERLTVAAALNRIDPADRFALLRCLAQAYRTGAEVECRARLVTAQGTQKTILICAQSDKRPDGSPMAIFGILRDISGEVASEAKLIAARDEARAAAVAKSEFLATMSHEIRTPMTGVMGMIDLIATTDDEGERAKYLAAMRQSTQMLTSVLDSILDFSKVDAGRIDLQRTPFDLVELARQTVLLFANAGSAKGIGLTLEAPADGPSFVFGDPLRIQQILSNFISNAIKFTNQGRVVVSLRARPGRKGHRLWQIAVSDTGAGIRNSQLKRLFEPFVQVGERLTGGTGLGLAISRRLAEAMGGSTSVRSKPGRGSTFALEIELPMERAGHPPAPALSAASDAAGLRALSVLVAEDNPINQMLIAAIVRRLGHRATTVDNGRRAVDCAAAKRFDCILMDMQMPEMDGLQATRAIRDGGGASAAAPIIAITADAAPERRRFYANIGLTGFMTKPIDTAQLRQTLTDIAARPPTQPRPARGPTGIDHQQIEDIRTTLGEDKLRDLLALAQCELSERPRAMRRLGADGDHERLRSEAHNFKGAAASLGLVGVARAAKAVEVASPGPALVLALRQLDREAARAVSAIGPMVRSLPAVALARA